MTASKPAAGRARTAAQAAPAIPLFRPFRALLAAPARAGEVASPPYDVVTIAEAQALAKDKPWSFLHVSRPEIDLAPGADAHSPAAYAQAAEAFRRMIEAGVLAREASPGYYVWRMRAGDHEQTGLAAAASVAAYEAGLIRRHELTRPDKEDDRVRHMEALNAQTGPVFLVHRPHPPLAALLAQAADGPPTIDVKSPDGARHQIWPVRAPEAVARLSKTLDAAGSFYVADGHHRSAAAARVAAARRAAAASGEEASCERFLTVAFPSDEAQVLAYHRVARDLNGLSVEDFLARLAVRFSVAPSAAPVAPAGPHEFGVYVAGSWHDLTLRAPLAPDALPLERLDVALLSKEILEPILAIGDPRRDPRIDFVGGGRGIEALQQKVDRGEAAVAFALFPTQLEDMMAVADAGAVMPPKSTWFEPKLADGLISHVLD